MKGPPKSQPIYSLKDCLHETPVDDWSRARNRKPRFQRTSTDAGKQKVMVCHDMKGGYLDDAWVQGDFGNTASTDVIADSVVPYTYQHWNRTDIFIYFSHYRLAIPPSTWIQAAHRNGCPIIGTFITEGEEGRLANEHWLVGDSSPEPSPSWSPLFADRMVALAVEYGFDGWFLNLESPLDETRCNVKDHLIPFLRYFTNKMHETMPGSFVIWYDSLTIDGMYRVQKTIYCCKGRVDWQNEINGLNGIFLDVTDGFFTNYTWQEDYPKRSARYTDDNFGDEFKWKVYTGNDLYGRGTYGGGGFDIDVALHVIRKAPTSIAIFAPGWAYEGKGEKDFLENDHRLWYHQEKGIARSVPPLKLCTEKGAFYTNFDRGFGDVVAVEGKITHVGRWQHIGMTSILPDYDQQEKFRREPIVKVDENCTASFAWQPVSELAYNGGTSIQLMVKPKEIRRMKDTTYFSTLFHTQLHLPANKNAWRMRTNIWKSVTLSKHVSFGVFVRLNNGDIVKIDKATSQAMDDSSDGEAWIQYERTVQSNSVSIDEIGLYVKTSNKHLDTISVMNTLGYVGDISLEPIHLSEHNIVHGTNKSPIHSPYAKWASWDAVHLYWQERNPQEIAHVNLYAKGPDGETWLGYSLNGRFYLSFSNKSLKRGSSWYVLIRPVDMFGREMKCAWETQCNIPFLWVFAFRIKEFLKRLFRLN